MVFQHCSDFRGAGQRNDYFQRGFGHGSCDAFVYHQQRLPLGWNVEMALLNGAAEIVAVGVLQDQGAVDLVFL